MNSPLTTSNTLLIQLSLIALLLFVVQSQETVTLTNYATIFRSIKIVNAAPPRVGPIALPTLKNALYIPIFFPIFSGFETAENMEYPTGNAKSSPIVSTIVEIIIPIIPVSNAYEK